MWSESLNTLDPYEAIQEYLAEKRRNKINRDISRRNKRQKRFRSIKWIHRILYNYGYYQIDDLQGWGHCGICGKYMPNTVMEKEWAWGVCDECKSEKH